MLSFSLALLQANDRNASIAGSRSELQQANCTSSFELGTRPLLPTTTNSQPPQQHTSRNNGQVASCESPLKPN
ncbi:hypothetical protein VTJ04DRAFT_8304 [Mycothermus thermophilus]|uniref:uncharacterized protein n=1 Tax=Humicola insolens TaxID=85995 RepID=UPI0037432323